MFLKGDWDFTETFQTGLELYRLGQVQQGWGQSYGAYN
jgi:hypothetical protein